MMIPESIYYLYETGIQIKQEDYLWPVAGKATVHDKVFMVCDGDGSFYNGGIASKLVCRYMAAKVLRFSEQKISGERIDKWLGEARDRLIHYARENRLDTDLATTFSMLILYDQKVLISWYGDSPIYHLRGDEILFKNTTVARGIQVDHSPIYAETKWMDDVQDGDYFLLGSKGFTENVTDDVIKLLVSQSDNGMTDLPGSFRRLAFEKSADNYSMYLIKLNKAVKKRFRKTGIAAIFILPFIIIAIFITNIYFRGARTSGPAVVQPSPREAILPIADSVKNNIENPPAALQKDSVQIQIKAKPEQTNQTAPRQKEPAAQLLLKFSTDEACKLKITNTDLDESIDWDLSANDNGTLYLKPGKYSIVATSVTNSSKSKTYLFDVQPGNAHATQNLHIRF